MDKTYGVVLLPDDEIATAVRQLARGESGNLFPEDFRPHLSLLHCVLGEEKLPAVRNFLRSVPCDGAPNIICYATREKGDWRFLEVHRSPWLERMQEAVLPIAEMRSRDIDFVWRAAATKYQLASYARYGYPNVGLGWSPHFTFGRLAGGRLSDQWRSIAKCGTFRSLCLGVMGDHGMLLETLFSRDLAQC